VGSGEWGVGSGEWDAPTPDLHFNSIGFVFQ